NEYDACAPSGCLRLRGILLARSPRILRLQTVFRILTSAHSCRIRDESRWCASTYAGQPIAPVTTATFARSPYFSRIGNATVYVLRQPSSKVIVSTPCGSTSTVAVSASAPCRATTRATPFACAVTRPAASTDTIAGSVDDHSSGTEWSSFPNASVTRVSTAAVSRYPVSRSDGSRIVSAAGGPASAVAVSTSSTTPPTTTRCTCSPAIVPNVQSVAASPCASVSKNDGEVVPCPGFGKNSTRTPSTG